MIHCGKESKVRETACVRWNLKWNGRGSCRKGSDVYKRQTEGVLPSNYYYTIDPSLAMSPNIPFRERLKARKGRVVKITENERGFYVTAEFDDDN